MAKSDSLTPKAIAKRTKAKGLLQVKFYCQECRTQFRDNNAFECHCTSESHHRQMHIFGQDPDRIVEGYSEEFKKSFLDLMRCSHRFSPVAAKLVYDEYIRNGCPIRMNATKWATLTEFVKYLGRTGKCKVEDSPRGWFLTYIDRDPETLFKDRSKAKRLKAGLVDEERQERATQAQIERARSSLPSSQTNVTRTENSQQGSKPNNLNPSGGKVSFVIQPTTSKLKAIGGVKFGLEERTDEGSSRKRKGRAWLANSAESESSQLGLGPSRAEFRPIPWTV